MDVMLVASLLFLVFAAALLGAAEAAILRVRRVRIEVSAAEGSRAAAALLPLLDDLPRVLNTVLFVVLLVQIGAATIAGVIAERWFGSIAVTIGSVLLTLVLFVYTEAIPKTYAVHHAESVAVFTAPLVRGLAFVLRPLVSLLLWFADLQAPGSGVATPSVATEEELLLLTAEAAAHGTIEPEDAELIDRVFVLGDRRVNELMVPRRDVVGVDANATVDEALTVAIAAGHRRVAVWDGAQEHIVGVARLQDLASQAPGSPTKSVHAVMVDPIVTPESRRVVDLLGDMQSRTTHFAVVIDEHGATTGIVTIEDVVEELVGPVSDEGEPVESDIADLGDGSWLVTGTADVVEFERASGSSLPEGDWNTMGGLAMGVTGSIPKEGDMIPIGEFKATVIAVEDRRVLRMRLDPEIAQIR